MPSHPSEPNPKTSLRLLAIEGPAGSGKSTLINNLIGMDFGRVPELPFEVPLMRPRAYEYYYGVVLSQIKDLLSIQAVVARHDHTQTAILDRFLLSQWAYGSIRAGTPPDFETGLTIIESGFDLILKSREHLLARMGLINSSMLFFPSVHIDLNFVIMIPTVELLTELRKRGGKKYPYSPEIEVSTYTEIARMLQTWIELGVRDLNQSVQVTLLRYKETGEIDEYLNLLKDQ